jgi:uncharacterized membrane protein HdeD (DUF308 family)
MRIVNCGFDGRQCAAAGPFGYSDLSNAGEEEFVMSERIGAVGWNYDAMVGVLARNWWAVAIRGVLAVLFGIIALFLPGPTMLSLVLVFAAYCLIDGVFGIISAVRAARAGERWGSLVFEGIVDLAAAAVALLWPGITVLVFVLLVAAWAIVTGVLELVAAFRLHSGDGRGWLMLGGVVSLIYGGVLMIAPMIGAVVLTWWIGAYALVFGVSLLVLAVRLRNRQESDRTTPPVHAHA